MLQIGGSPNDPFFLVEYEDFEADVGMASTEESPKHNEWVPLWTLCPFNTLESDNPAGRRSKLQKFKNTEKHCKRRKATTGGKYREQNTSSSSSDDDDSEDSDEEYGNGNDYCSSVGKQIIIRVRKPHHPRKPSERERSFSVGDRVEAHWKDGWWLGTVLGRSTAEEYTVKFDNPPLGEGKGDRFL